MNVLPKLPQLNNNPQHTELTFNDHWAHNHKTDDFATTTDFY